ncbi:hypothetical protein Pelo_4512 [Pelomyxa schiedti]|nr:hypothetical protein Pelo_4512 [Pelomyxa schiedti]
MVVTPGWLGSPGSDDADYDDDYYSNYYYYCNPSQGDLLRVAEAMFPLVALCCSRVLLAADAPAGGVGTYSAVSGAGELNAPRCVAWMLNHRYTGAHSAQEHQGYQEHQREHEEEEEEEKNNKYKDVRLVVKEVAAVMVGLCVGGHLAAARSLFGDDCGGDCGGYYAPGGACESPAGGGGATRVHTSLPLLWDGRCVAGWKKYCNWRCSGETICERREEGGDGDVAAMGVDEVVSGLRERVREYMRASCGNTEFVQRAFGSGHVSVARWLVSVLRITRDDAPWMHGPLGFSLFCGKMEVAKWMLDQFDLRNSLPKKDLLDVVDWCARGGSPENVKWCEANFPVHINRNDFKHALLSNKHSTLEVCKWLEDTIRATGVSEWTMSDVKSQEINRFCKKTGDINLVKWLITERGFTPTRKTFFSSCATSPKRGSSLARWLYPQVAPTLSPSHFLKALVKSLASGNTEVADWLEGTFHLMDSVVNPSKRCTEDTLIALCTTKTSGLKWLLQHLSHPSEIKARIIKDAIACALYSKSISNIQLMLETFTHFHPQSDPELYEKMVAGLTVVAPDVLERFFGGIEGTNCCSSERWMTEAVARCLTSSALEMDEIHSNTVKWLVSKFGLSYNDHIRRNNNSLLFKLLSWSKNRCAQWLIETFYIPLEDQIVEMTREWAPYSSYLIDLAGWKLLLEHYHPAIDATMIKRHFAPLLDRCPHLVNYTESKFYGLTLGDHHHHSQNNSRFGAAWKASSRHALQPPLQRTPLLCHLLAEHHHLIIILCTSLLLSIITILFSSS